MTDAETVEPKDDVRLVGGWIRWQRSKKNLSAERVAKHVGISVSTLYIIERSERALTSLELAVRLADALGVDRGTLVTRAVLNFRYPDPDLTLFAFTSAGGDVTMQDETASESGIDRDFLQLSREREMGAPLTSADRESAQRVLDTYWPKFGTPRPLPERWRKYPDEYPDEDEYFEFFDRAFVNTQ
ncbi:helix-turn-helix domain-containing protein [Amycolatopsis sp. NPDC059657]|uniref:helix-turn-helix domain-containing protein n=1 Tax=Amycolatopsis sp. NPDC059657 TaxID=3346899 RepID=UPI00366A5657